MKFVKNVWKDRDKFLEIQKKRAKNLTAGKYRTSPTLTVTNIKDGDETTDVDHVGPTIIVTFICTYQGSWDSFYIAQNSSALGLPQYGDYAAESDSLVYCSHFSVKQRKVGVALDTSGKSNGVFDFITTWSPITPERLDLSPLDRGAIFEFGGTDLTEVRRTDASDPPKPIVNSAGDYFEGLPEFYVQGFELTMTYNVSANPSALVSTYSFTTNLNTWNGQDALSGAIGKINAVETFETYQSVQIQYWRVTVPIRFRTDGQGWGFQPFDYGYRYVSGGKAVNYTDPSTGVYGPVFLNGSGGLLGGDGTTRTTDPVIFPAASGDTPAGYQVLQAVDWSGASFPNPFAT